MGRRSGWVLALLSAASFGTSGTFATALMADGWTAGAAVTVRVGLAALVLTPVAVAQLRGRWRLLGANLPGVLAFGLLAVAGCQLTYFLAVARLSVGVALLLEYSGVLLVVLWTWAVSGRRPSRTTWTGVLVAVVGLVLVLDVASGARVDGLGVLFGLLAAVGLAVYFVVSSRTEEALPPLVTAWGGLSVGAIGLGLTAALRLLPFRASTDDVVLAGHPTSWLVPVLGLSMVAAAFAYATGVAAVQRLGARLASFTGLTEVLFAVLFAWVALSQAPGPLQGVGAVVVLAGIVLVKLGEGSEDAAELAVEPVPEATGAQAPA